ncbi:primase C-terminal domain-containing protein [Aliarcobacter cryaerophilus]|uniref:primase C-terminal domain-containing protein n=1 Tax=Aliarcobacter cryaerophilus TaxID=28198 RepID=UPI0021B4E4DC|nr:primase C-terminal domain-containing protein [Aliarcobacter cryaerophilus]MCT7470524.1 primase C-terminal domain-containing protein [Aliarcobacter cryaerophilus]
MTNNDKKWVDWKEINKKKREKRELEQKIKEEERKEIYFRHLMSKGWREKEIINCKFLLEKNFPTFERLDEFYEDVLKYDFEEIKDVYTLKNVFFNSIEYDFLFFRYIKEILIPGLKNEPHFDKFLKWKYKKKNDVLEFLIPSFPTEIKSGNTKTTSNKTFFPTAYSIDNHKFINYNSKDRINFLCFDLDYHNGAEAIKSFPKIEDFKKHLIDQLGADLEPSFIIQTTKGYQFFYHLKVPVLTKHKAAIQFLKDIKAGTIELLGLDKIASNRLYGVYRGPLQNPSEFNFNKKDFELKAFSKFAKSSRRTDYQLLENIASLENVKIGKFEEGSRNEKLFIAGLNFAKGKKNLNFEIIFHYIFKINERILKPLDESEVKSISSSVFRYYTEDKIQLTGSDENINRGIMGLKSSKLKLEEKQKLAAARSNEVREINFEANKTNFEKANAIKSINNKTEIIAQLQAAKDFLKRNHLKLTKAALIKKTKLNKKTVYKYFEFLK